MKNAACLLIGICVCVGELPASGEDELSKLINSDSAQERFAKVVQLSDARPSPFIKLIQNERVRHELKLSETQLQALSSVRAVDLGQMYDAVDMYKMKDVDFDAFFADLKQKWQAYLADANERTVKVLNEWQARRLRQIQCQYHFLVHLEPQKALYGTRADFTSEAFVDLTSRIRQALVRSLQQSHSDDMSQKYIRKLELIGDYVGKRNLVTKIGKLHRFWFAFDEDAERRYDSVLGTVELQQDSVQGRRGRGNKLGATKPAGYSEYTNSRILAELQLDDQQREKLDLLLLEWKQERAQTTTLFDLKKASDRVSKDVLFGDNREETDSRWSLKIHQLLTDEQQRRMMQLQLQSQLMATSQAPDLRLLGFHISDARQDEFSQQWFETFGDGASRPEGRIEFKHVHEVLLKHFDGPQVDELLGKPFSFSGEVVPSPEKKLPQGRRRRS